MATMRYAITPASLPTETAAQLRHQRSARACPARLLPILASTTMATPRALRASTRRADFNWTHQVQQSRLALPAAPHVARLWQTCADHERAASRHEPLFFRANTGDCITFKLTNLMPDEYQAGRLPGAHADRHYRPAHSPGEVRRDSARTAPATAGTMKKARSASRKCWSASMPSMRAGGGWTPFTGSTLIPLAPKQHPFFTTIPRAGRADRGGALVR